MRILLVLVLALVLCSPIMAQQYRVDNVMVERATSVSGGTVSCNTANVATPLSTTSVPIFRVTLRSDASSNSDTFVGNSQVGPSSRGLQLGHGTATTSNSVVIEVDNLSDVYINCASAAKKVNYIAELK